MSKKAFKKSPIAKSGKSKLLEAHIDSMRMGLFKAGAICASAIVLLYLFDLVLVVIKGFPSSSLEEWFSILQSNRSVGILRTFAPDIVAIALKAPLYIALFFFLRQTKKGYPTFISAVVLAFIGMAVYFASNITFPSLVFSSLLSCSRVGFSARPRPYWELQAMLLN